MYVEGPLAFATATLARAPVKSPYSQTIVGSGGFPPYSWTFDSGRLPAGLTFNPATAIISGTPTTVETTTFTLSIKDYLNRTVTREFSLEVYNPLVLAATALPRATTGTIYSTSFSASGGATPYSFALTSGTLPAGLSLNSVTGTISGTPVSEGVYAFTVTVTDTLTRTDSKIFTIYVDGPLSITSTLSNGVVGTAYNQTLSTSGGFHPVTWAVTSGALPAGLTLNSSSGVISGTPTTAAASTFVITATDAVARTNSKSFTVTIYAVLNITTASAAHGVVGYAYNQSLAAAGGLTPFTWSVSVGSLPAGLALNASSGLMSGTPTTVSRPQFTIRVQDTFGQVATKQFTVDIAATPLVLSPTIMPRGMLGVAYSIMLNASGGSASYTFSKPTGTLPTGLSLNATTGIISGTPTATGTFTFTAMVSDPYSRSDSKSFTIFIDPVFTITTTSLNTVVVGSPYNQSVAVIGGLAPYTWSITSGVLPSGLTINSATGVISGTPTTASGQPIVVEVQDSAGRKINRQYTLTVIDPLVLLTTSMPNGALNEPYSDNLLVSGGVPPYTFTLTGQLPAGLSLNSSSGLISGIPTVAGLTNAGITIVDSSLPTHQTKSTSFSIRIWSMATIVTTAKLPSARINTAITPVALTAKAGSSPYSWSLLSGTMPPGVTISSGGLISGTPTVSGNYTFTIRATDSSITPVNADKQFYLYVGDTIQISTATIPFGSVGVPFNYTLYSVYGVAPYTWSIISGTLPAGLSFSASGIISGTPTVIGSSEVTFRVADSDNPAQTTTKTLTISIDPLTINSTSLTSGVVGSTYSQSVVGAGGYPPYSWSIDVGTLPTGLTFDTATGVISGLPTAVESRQVTFTIHDYLASTVSKQLTINIYNPLVLAAATLPRGTTGSAYSSTIAATGGATPYTFAVTTGLLPNGLTINSTTGTISGTPAVAGTFIFSITITDAASRTDAKSFTINVGNPISITTANLSNGLVGSAYSQAMTASGSLAPYNWSIITGTLPAGLILNSSTGVISGTPTTVDRQQFTIRVTDAYNSTATSTYTVDISNTLSLAAATLPRRMYGVAYQYSLNATGGAVPYNFAVTSGALPTGIILSTSTGVISGTPTVTGSFTFTVRVQDYYGRQDSKSFTIVIDPVFSITTVKLNDAVVNVPYNGSCTPMTSGLVGWWSGNGNANDSSGNGNNGSISGTVTYQAGKIDQSFGFAGNGGITINDTSLSLSPSSLSAETWFKVGGQYFGSEFMILYKGNYDPYPHMAYSIEIDGSTNKLKGRSDSAGFMEILSQQAVNDNLWHHAVLTIDNTSKTAKLYLDGILQNSVNFTGVVQQSSEPLSIGKYYYNSMYNFSGAIDEIRVYNRALSSIEIQARYNNTSTCTTDITGQTFTASGGLSPYTWNISSGVLPNGLVLNPTTGIISGTPTVSGSQQIVVSAQDSASRTTTRQYTLTVTEALTLLTTSMPNGAINEPYAEFMRASGGVPPYTFTLASTSQLPAGLSLNSATGLVSGTHTVVGLTNAAINVSDSSYPTPQTLTSRSFSIGIWSMSTITTSATLSGIRNGQSLTPVTLIAKVGTAPYLWSLLSGNMPAGVSISTDGIIRGTPTTAGNYTFTIRATDSSVTPVNADKLFYLTVSDPIQITTQSISVGSVGIPFSHTLYAANGVVPYTWSITSGTLPAGLTLNGATGVISGTPTAIGNKAVTFTATDSDSTPQSTSKALAIAIDPLTITTLALPNGNQAVGYAATINTIGGIAPVAWTITTGSLPQGITLDSGSGTINGTTPYCGSFPVTVQAVDTATPATTTSKGFTLTIVCSPGYQITGSVTINNGEPSTLLSAVNLTIAVANDVLATQMRFSTDNSSWSSWETFATSKGINLADGYGTKYVYVQIKDAADNIATFIDDIYVRTFYPLTLTFAGTGGGNVNGGISCVKGEACPPQSFEEGTKVTLAPSADSNSTFTSWNDVCVVTGINCEVTMNSAKTATSTFTQADKVRIGKAPFTTTAPYLNLVSAFSAIKADEQIQARSIDFTETLNITSPANFKGGFNAAYTNNSGSFTTVKGKLTIGVGGKLTVEGLKISQ